jgi:hypothetical protein
MLSPSAAVAVADRPNNGVVGDVPPTTDGYTNTVQTITPDIAYEILTTMAYERQRRTRPQHVASLARELLRGTFKPGTIEINTLPEGDQYLIDGYHRLQAIIEAGVSSPMVIVNCAVGSMDEVDANYAVTDTGLIRTSVDRATAYNLPSRFALSPRWVTSLGYAVAAITGGFEFDSNDLHTRDAVRSDAVRIPLMETWLPEMHRFVEILAQNKGMWMGGKTRNASLVAIALVTLRYQPERAEQFWAAVAKNDGLGRTQPERILIDYLQSSSVKREGTRAYARAIAYCWNASYDGRPLTYALRHKKNVVNNPILIKGTPYTGKQVVRLDQVA